MIRNAKERRGVSILRVRNLLGGMSGENHRHSGSSHGESMGTKYHRSKKLTVTMRSIMFNR